jgi:hypothetical protein
MPRYNSPHYSRSRWSGWSGFSLRLVGSLVVFAVAALSGAVIGGVSIYLINDAANPPSSAGANGNPTPALTDSATTSAPAPQQAPAAANGKPVRLVDPAFPPPTPVESKPAAPAATATASQPPAEKPVSSVATQPQQTASQPTPQENLQATAHDTATHDTTTHEAATQDATAQAAAPEASEHASSSRKATRKRVTNARQQASPQAADQAQYATRRPVYDYYDRDSDQQRASAMDSRDPRVRRSLSQTQQRIIVRRQDSYDRDDRYGRDDRDADAGRRFPAQPRPAQSFFGFGARRYDNDRD